MAVKLAAAMDRAGVKSNRELARKLGTDSSLVGKWLGQGEQRVYRITSRRHREALPQILGTPEDYFEDPPVDRLDRIEALLSGLAETVDVLALNQERILDRLGVPQAERIRRTRGFEQTTEERTPRRARHGQART